jgi:hypothetical protein
MEERFSKFQRETNQRARDEINAEVTRIRNSEISQVPPLYLHTLTHLVTSLYM